MSNYPITSIELPENIFGWMHPVLKERDTGNENSEVYTDEQWSQLQENIGAKIVLQTLWYEDIPDIPEEDGCDWSKWKPEPPEQGMFLIGAFDTEDGPCLWWAKPKASIPEGYTLISNDELKELMEFKDLYRRAVVNAKKLKRTTNWKHLVDLGVGSVRAERLCKELGIDPDGTNMHMPLNEGEKQ